VDWSTVQDGLKRRSGDTSSAGKPAMAFVTLPGSAGPVTPNAMKLRLDWREEPGGSVAVLEGTNVPLVCGNVVLRKIVRRTRGRRRASWMRFGVLEAWRSRRSKRRHSLGRTAGELRWDHRCRVEWCRV
jgi:hypothetical protein